MSEKKAIPYAVKTTGIGKGSIKDVDTVGRTVTGFYNAYNYCDSYGDILVMGCSKRTIKAKGPNSEATAKIKHALNHDLTQLPGKILTLKEATVDGITGIYFETRMSDTTLGNDTLKNYLEGVYDNHSIGFRYLNYEVIENTSKDKWNELRDMCTNPESMKDRTMVWAVKEIELFEGSTVAFGANSLTPYLGVKSGNRDSYLLALNNRMDTLVKTLRTGTQSDEMLETFELQVAQIKAIMADLVPEKQAEVPPTPEKIIAAKAHKINYANLAAQL